MNYDHSLKGARTLPPIFLASQPHFLHVSSHWMVLRVTHSYLSSSPAAFGLSVKLTVYFQCCCSSLL